MKKKFSSLSRPPLVSAIRPLTTCASCLLYVVYLHARGRRKEEKEWERNGRNPPPTRASRAACRYRIFIRCNIGHGRSVERVGGRWVKGGDTAAVATAAALASPRLASGHASMASCVEWRTVDASHGTIGTLPNSHSAGNVLCPQRWWCPMCPLADGAHSRYLRGMYEHPTCTSMLGDSDVGGGSTS